MKQNEIYVAFALVAVVAYALGVKKATAKAVEANRAYDPLGWLNGYTG